MPGKQEKLFKKSIAQFSFDDDLHQRIEHSMDNYTARHRQAQTRYSNLTLARERAAFIRRKVIENMEKYLLEFENNFKRNGGKIIWANDADEACREVLKILKKHEVKSVVKSKSMATEEIGLNKFLSSENIEVTETDLGEYIQQMADEPPFHIVTPAMHHSVSDIKNIIEKKWNEHVEENEKNIAGVVKKKLRPGFVSAGVGITGANFLLADTGSISITENEGNALLTTSFARIHIALAGIEKLLPSINDLPLFLSLLATYGTGTPITNYNTVFTPSNVHTETDGPNEMYVVLLDNGRTNLLAQVPQREALACIKCGACMNVCPVFRTIGGHAYHTTYSGPIGAVITPFLKNFEEHIHLSYASSLCGACTKTCPVNIDLHKLLLYNRQADRQQRNPGQAEKLAWYLWKKSSLSRNFMNKGGASAKGFLLSFVFSGWSRHRSQLSFAKKSFNVEWREKYGIK